MSNGHLEGVGKRIRRFQTICFIQISFENPLQETSFCSFCLLYILLTRTNFDSSEEGILSVFVESGHG